jgi:putative transcriptional regulator
LWSEEETNSTSAAGSFGAVGGQRKGLRMRRVAGKSSRQSGRNSDRPVTNERRMAVLTGLVGLAAGRFLAQQEGQPEQDWAYVTPLIEQGCVLMSLPGERFAYRQQYFHKAVILLVNHRWNFDLGLIINRPTSFVTTQFGIPGPPWRIWYGGDCEGLITSNMKLDNVVHFCLHTIEEFASSSERVIPGVYLMEFRLAQQFVSQGRAQTKDFRLIFGYCGWGNGQLQRELDRGKSWKMASINQRIITSELQESACDKVRPDDGIAEWQRFYSLVDSKFPSEVSERAEQLDDELGDEMLRQWVNVKLASLPGKP